MSTTTGMSRVFVARAQDAEHLVAVRRRHDEVEQHERGAHLLELGEGIGARSHGDVGQVRAGERLDQDVSADRIVIHDENRAENHPRPQCSREARMIATRASEIRSLKQGKGGDPPVPIRAWTKGRGPSPRKPSPPPAPLSLEATEDWSDLAHRIRRGGRERGELLWLGTGQAWYEPMAMAVLVFFLVQVGVPGALFLWARWIRSCTGAPSYAARVGQALPVITAAVPLLTPLLFVAGTIFSLHAVASAQLTAAQRQSVLASSVAEAFYDGLFVWLLGVVLSTLWLGYVTWRWRGSTRPPSPPDEPHDGS